MATIHGDATATHYGELHSTFVTSSSILTAKNVERLIDEKKKGEKITTVKQPRKAQVVDLMEALKKALSRNLDQQAPKSPRDRAPVQRSRYEKGKAV